MDVKWLVFGVDFAAVAAFELFRPRNHSKNYYIMGSKSINHKKAGGQNEFRSGEVKWYFNC